MQLTYDPKQNVAYITLRSKTAEVQAIRVSDELNVDLAPDGVHLRPKIFFRANLECLFHDLDATVTQSGFGRNGTPPRRTTL